MDADATRPQMNEAFIFLSSIQTSTFISRNSYNRSIPARIPNTIIAISNIGFRSVRGFYALYPRI